MSLYNDLQDFDVQDEKSPDLEGYKTPPKQGSPGRGWRIILIGISFSFLLTHEFVLSINKAG
jgi:hypothetical protein